ncbi:Glycoside hydrolase, family 24 [uncultured Caudovirales phage]|uniref:Lysozyme n=1 Tax=uncultured Caudovirales phage TaxID=2100421 RepID=A0A6J5NF62_9CAUD|nr:Glycoside hydrolase, family 24 [uncultured Caudovirales phage]
MPTIPTIALSQLKPLPNTPDPVLDREKRPTMDLSGVMQAAGRLGKAGMMPDINPAPFVADAGALDAVGRAVTQAGGILEAHAMKRMEAKNDADLADAELALKNEQADFENWKMENPNPDTWGPEWERRGHEALQTQLSNEHLSRSGREALALQGKRWLGNSLLDVSRDSTKATYARAASSVRAEYERAVAAGDFAGAEAAAAKGEEKGYFFPHQAQAMREGIVEKQKEFKRDATINVALQDPDTWLSANTRPEKGQDPREWRQIRAIVEGAAADDYNATQSELSDFLAEHPTATAEDVVKTAAGRLRPGELQKWTDAADKNLDAAEKAKRATPEWINQKFGELIDRTNQFVDSFEGSAYSNRESWSVYNDLKSEILQLPADRRGEITEKLEKKWRNEAPAPRGSTKHYIDESLKDFFNQGAFGPLEKRVSKEPGDTGYYQGTKEMKSVTDTEGRAQAQLALARATDAMDGWLKQNPKATADEANAALYRFSGASMRMDEAAKLLKGVKVRTDALPAAVPLPDLTAIKAGLSGGAGGAGGAAGASGAVGAVGEDLVSTVKGFEGFTPTAEGDYKQTSVGYGTRAKSADETISKDEADQRLRSELGWHAKNIDRAAAAVGAKLSKGQRDALISFDFNTGKGAYLIESSGGNMAEVKRRLQLYTKAGGEHLEGLAKRRAKEAAIFGD